MKKQISEPNTVAISMNKMFMEIASTKTVKELVETLGVEGAKETINKLLAKYE